jgi:hypothetical protein
LHQAPSRASCRAANLKLVKLCFETGTALDIIQSTFKVSGLSLLCSEKLGEDFDPELSLLFALSFDGLPDPHFDPTHRHRGRRATGVWLARIGRNPLAPPAMLTIRLHQRRGLKMNR